MGLLRAILSDLRAGYRELATHALMLAIIRVGPKGPDWALAHDLHELSNRWATRPCQRRTESTS